jgi:hypothetical protein
MNTKRKPIVILLSGMMLASLAIVAADSAWSEAPRKGINKKTTAKKPATKKPRATGSTTLKSAPAPKVVTSPLSKPEITPGTSPQPVGTPALAPKIVAAPAQAIAAKPAQPQTPAPTNPYLTVPQANPWNVGIVKAPVQANPYLNPYLAYRHVPPAAAPTPWSVPAIQALPNSAPTWVNPFLAFQFPALPSPVPAPQALQAPAAIPPAVINPYLAYRLPPTQPTPPTPWTAPASPPVAFSAPFPAQFTAPFPAPFPTPAWTNPFQAQQTVAVAPALPTLPAFKAPAWSGNPYLAYQYAPAAAPAIAAPVAPPPAKPATAVAPPPALQPPPAESSQLAVQDATPWTIPSPPISRKPVEGASPSLAPSLDSLKSTFNLFSGLPPMDQAILPVVKTVYPTGEKPLKVLTFKCPTELVGITPLPTKALHELVNLAMDGINGTDLLPFNMQQVCQ